ncbi:SpoIIE family protein phosphatase [Streptomyces sp. NPDC088732]|uniref:PP2C family protein-serine/threonine phosphatase n=1 Tax=Streptomyces sp. NPDC088732 TaxID=3365879 RepID=UPI00382C3F85
MPPGLPYPDSGGTAGGALLSLALASMMDDVHAHAGAVYLLAPDAPVLEMAVGAGLPRAFAAPWERVGLASRLPVADALRERRLVWIGGESEMARVYPRIALVLPYPYTMAALPVATDETPYGAVFLVLAASHPPELGGLERDLLTSACRRLALRLEREAVAGRPVRREPGTAEAGEAAPRTAASPLVHAEHMVARLPDGLCALDVHGRVTYANTAAATLLGVPVKALVSARLWTAMPWLNDPAYEDRFRGALISQRAMSFVALRPPNDWLRFCLHPGTDGVTVRVAPAPTASAGAPAVHSHHNDHSHRGEHSEDGGHGGSPDPGPRGAARLVTISHVLNLAVALTRAAGVQDVVDLLAGEIMPAIGGRTVALLASEGGRMRVLGHRGYPDPRMLDHFEGLPVSAPTASVQVLVRGTPSFVESPERLAQLYPGRPAVSDGMASWAFLPLIASGRAVGSCVLGYPEPHTFSADERAVLTALGGLIAQAAERARLYDIKHRLAHGLQAALLPHTLPSPHGLEVAARYLPGTEGMDIGGDFYDMTRVGDRVAAVVGDVEGHNVKAAGLMGQVRTAVRAYSAAGQSPGQVMESTNRLLVDLDAGLFASCVHLHLDIPGRRALVARAGHPHPLLREPDGRVSVLDLAGGPLLGVESDACYPTTEVPFPPGSVLALYTDGLVEAPGTDIDDALADLAEHLALTGHLSLEEVADGLLAHTAGRRGRTDDVVLLLLRARAPVV